MRILWVVLRILWWYFEDMLRILLLYFECIPLFENLFILLFMQISLWQFLRVKYANKHIFYVCPNYPGVSLETISNYRPKITQKTIFAPCWGLLVRPILFARHMNFFIYNGSNFTPFILNWWDIDIFISNSNTKNCKLKFL